MGENSKIEWCHATFNHVIGCTKVAAGCTHCYAESFAKRTGKAKWGPQGTRVKTSESYWKQPLKWNREAEAAGERRRVFCASMADVFEDWSGPLYSHRGERLSHVEGACEIMATLDDVRRDLFKLIDATPHLDWLLLTKRPENIRRMWPQIGFADASVPGTLGRRPFLANCWLGTSIATQTDADRNIPLLLECRDLAPVLFLSIEPFLEAVELDLAGIDWVIVGGESGHGARPMHPDWARSIRDQCQAAEVAFHFKQWGEWREAEIHLPQEFAAMAKQTWTWLDRNGESGFTFGTEDRVCMHRVGKKAAGRLLDGIEYSQFPEVNHG